MAVKPVINSITPWDATVGKMISFSYSGNLPVSNRAIIYNAVNLEVVYDEKQNTSSLIHNIPANVLKTDNKEKNGNGHKYAIEIEVTDNEGTVFLRSDKVYFWCLATPEFYYTTPINDANIDTPTINFETYYAQENGEKLYSYRHYLFDNTKNEIASSDMNYTSDNLSYSFKGLNNHASYFIQTVGVTQNGINVDTGKLHFFVNYENTGNFAIMNAESDDNATVTGYTNIVSIDSNEDADSYVLLGSYVQLLDQSITYETNYKIERDFTMQLKVSHVQDNRRILYMTNKTNKIEITSYIFDDGTVRYYLTVDNGLTKYVRYSDPLTVDDNDSVIISLRRIENLYNFNAYKSADV